MDKSLIDARGGQDVGFMDFVVPLRRRWMSLVLGPLVAGALAYGGTFLVAPMYTSRVTFIPPQPQQSAAAAALSSLGALSGLVGGSGIAKNSADQYVALLQSVTIADRLIDEFQLMKVYDKALKVEARERLSKYASVSLGKKDGLISVEVEDEDPARAAKLANRFVEELRILTGRLALTEAQQRREFFERQLKSTKDNLTTAQTNLQASGFNAGALKAEPRAAAEGYAQVKAEVTAVEVRLQALRRNFADSTPEVQNALATLSALRSQLAKAEEPVGGSGGPDYIGKFREFKYQETLFELFSRQFELAKLDESREGSLMQVIDIATPAERKSSPKRALTAASTAALVLVLLAVWHVSRHLQSRYQGSMPGS